jgi:lysophospholipase L1-like esterase
MPLRSYITCVAALCATLSFTTMILGTGIVAACSGYEEPWEEEECVEEWEWEWGFCGEEEEEEEEGGGGEVKCPKPIVTTEPAALVTDVSALLKGTINTQGCTTTYSFEWGPSSSPTSYPKSTPINTTGPGSNEHVQASISGLTPGTSYHFRLSATNSGGWSPGGDKPFTTLSVPQYLALGDSYSSGTGTRLFYNATCRRSVYAYPDLLHQAHPNWTFINATCHGATTANVLNGQIPSQVSPNIKWVTYSIGGNDAKFGDVMHACVLKDELSCFNEISNSERIMTNELPHRLNTVNNAIKAKAPNAKVVVFDYPRLFMEQSCSIFSTLTVAEQRELNQASELLRREISAATARAGSNFVFKDVIPGFEPHQVCEGGSGSSTEWINGLSSPTEESFHPKPAGHANVYLPLARAVTG